MRKVLIVTALAAVMAIPVVTTASTADAASCKSRKVTGTVLGGVGGALLGGAVTHGSTGPIIGGLGGAVVGHEVGRSGCKTRYRTSYYRPASSARPYTASNTRPTRQYYDQYGRLVTVR